MPILIIHAETAMIARCRWAFLPLLLVLALAACKVDSTNPITPVDSAQPDTALYGVWRFRAPGELTYVHIGPAFSLGDAAAGAKARTKIVVIDHKANGLTDDSYDAYVSRVGRDRYLNVVQVDAGKTVGFIFVRYTRIDANTLRFATMNEDALKAAIQAGRIKGTIRGEGLASETTITAPSTEIAEFLAREGAKLFGTPFVLRRVAANVVPAQAQAAPAAK